MSILETKSSGVNGNQGPSQTKHTIEHAKPRPRFALPRFCEIPEQLQAAPAWVNWAYIWARDRECWTKVPFTRNEYFRLRGAKANDPRTWKDFDTVCSSSILSECHPSGNELGVGFEFSRADPYFGIDLDNCVCLATHQIAEWAAAIVARFPTYWEYSPSGTGLHGFGIGAKPGPRCRTASRPGIEIYDGITGGRFVAITGERLPGTMETLTDCQAALDTFYRELFPDPPASAPQHKASVPRDGAGVGSASLSLTLSDQDIITRAAAAANGAKFSALWAGDAHAYHGGDRSAADAALAAMLAFWTCRDAERIASLMWQSGLRRDKWKRRDYLPNTIAKACGLCAVAFDESDDYAPVTACTWIATEAAAPRPASVQALLDGPSAGKILASMQTVNGEPYAPPPIPENWSASFLHYRVIPACAYSVFLGHKHEGRCRRCKMACWRWGCQSCVPLLKDKWAEHLRVTLNKLPADTPLYSLWCNTNAYIRIRKRIKARGGEFFRSIEPNGGRLWVLTTIDPATMGLSAETVARATVTHTRDEGLSAAVNIVRSLHSCHRPISTSRGWKLPEEEKTGDWVRFGCIPGKLVDAKFEEIVAELGYKLADATPNYSGRIVSATDVLMGDDIGMCEKRHLYECLVLGEAVPSEDSASQMPQTSTFAYDPDGSSLLHRDDLG